MEIKQSRNSNRIRYEFSDDQLHYSLQDGSGGRSFSLTYTGISRDREKLEERNVWLRNVGLLWIAIGMASSIALRVFGYQTFPPAFWLALGIGCYLVYHLRTTRFTIIPSDKGNLFVIEDETGKRILDEIETRRARQFREEYDFMPEGDTPEQHRARFKWLHQEGALTDEELRQRLAMVDVVCPGEGDVVPGQGVVLN